MDPLSITVGCVTLITTIGKSSLAISAFVKDCRAARYDLDAIARELTSLENVLQLLKDDVAAANGSNIPDNIREHLSNVISNCSQVLADLDNLLRKHSGARFEAARWALSGKDDATKLRATLEAHRGALGLALDMISITTTREINVHTREIRGDTLAINLNTEHILEELSKIRSLLEGPERPNIESNLILQRYLDQISTYAETVFEDTSDMGTEHDPTLVPSEVSDPELPADLSNISISSHNSPLPETHSKELGVAKAESELQSGFSMKARPVQSHPSLAASSCSLRPHKLEGHSGYVYCIAFSLNGKLMISAAGDRTIRFWDPSTGEHLRKLKVPCNAVYAVDFSPDGTLFASSSVDGTVMLWNTARGTASHTFSGHAKPVAGVAFSPDGKLVASASNDRTVVLWDTIKGHQYRTLKGHRDAVQTVAFSPNGEHIASGSCDRTIRVWDRKTGNVLRVLSGHTGDVRAIAFSPNGLSIVSGSFDRTVRVWDPATGECSRTFKGHTKYVWSVTFSPDGKLIASGSADRTIRSWGVDTGKARLTHKGHTGRVFAIKFSPDGKLFASGSSDSSIRLWDTAALYNDP